MTEAGCVRLTAVPELWTLKAKHAEAIREDNCFYCWPAFITSALPISESIQEDSKIKTVTKVTTAEDRWLVHVQLTA